ncbi:1-phosphofructokinase [Brevinema andersonii]|uniref:1-phosphofructokinase n=1 Tax=Brevinema andersonii TaxID=34097 RepID=A0A1I1F3U9_BREAD|nr:1-phosphofructokinase family hexose kinase [Brevinema andersonii]SFB93626.1 1-phosphofructokinase [Brevinema andersonii]
MVLTVTLNPAVDYHMKIDSFSEGKSLSAKGVSFQAGGKGINVSRVLNNLGIANTALAVLGGFTGDYIKSQIPELKAISIKERTRINTKLRTAISETEIHGVAPELTLQEIEQVKYEIAHLTKDDTLILSGSLPKGVSDAIYKELALLVPDTRIIADTRGVALKEIITVKNLFLIKPNKDELSELFGCEICSNEEALKLAQNLKNDTNITYIIVSLGKDGAYLLTDTEVFYAPALEGELVSSVGAGDSLVAGFIARYLKSDDPKLSFAYGVACAAGTVFSHGLCTLETAERLVKNVKISQI